MKILPGKNVGTDSPFQPGALVMYEHDSVPLLAVVLGFKKDKYVLLNERAREAELPAIRLYALPGKLPNHPAPLEAKAQQLAQLHERASQQAFKIQLGDLWAVVQEQDREYEIKELCELLFSDNSLEHHLVTRVALLEDRLYFKRNKNAFSPRPGEVVEQLKRAEAARLEKERKKRLTVDAFRVRLADARAPLPPDSGETIEALKLFASGSPEQDAGHQKEAKELLELISQELKLQLHGSKENQAFSLLERLGIFRPDTNLSLIRHRWPVSFGAEALREADQVQVPDSIEQCLGRENRLDFTAIPCFTIDDLTTRDMDDALSLEVLPDGYRLGIHVSDVASAIAVGSATEREAQKRSTSIYLPDQTVHMLPETLAEDKLSLLEGSVRRCVSCIFQLDRERRILSSDLRLTLIRLGKRYTYDLVDELLDKGEPTLTFLHQLSVDLETERTERGAITVHKREVLVDLDDRGEPVLREIDEHGPSRGLVGEMAVLANGMLARFTRDKKIPALYRHQQAPEEQNGSLEALPPAGPAQDYAHRARLKKSSVSTEPFPHAALGLEVYLQATSPIRRYIDLCNQRQIVAHLMGDNLPYTADDLERIYEQCEEPLGHAQGISRETKRYWLLRILRRRLQSRDESSQFISGTVLRCDYKNPLVELDEVILPTLVKIPRQVETGEVLRFRIAAVDPRNDYLKLELA